MEKSKRKGGHGQTDGDVSVVQMEFGQGQYMSSTVPGKGKERMSLRVYESLVSEFEEFLSDYFHFLYELGSQVNYWKSGTGAME